jgi:NAD(P)-dependent dehydrogenase (short-subunit alcohol dehydrogenase family)
MRALDGKTAIIVGSATGIGRATGHEFAKAGARLTLADVNPAGEDVAAQIRDSGGEAAFVQLDVVDPHAVRAMVDATVERYGRLDILFNNAAALGDEVYGRDSDVASMDMDVWDRTFDVNVKGVVYASKFAIPHMIAGGGGAIVNTSSVDAIAGQRSKHAYCASKAAVSSLTLDMATAYADHNIRVNAIAPGLVMSPIAVRNLPAEYLEVSARNRLRSAPATPEEIAPLVRFLASDEASFITAQVFLIDGGTLNHQPDFERGMADLRELAELRAATPQR